MVDFSLLVFKQELDGRKVADSRIGQWVGLDDLQVPFQTLSAMILSSSLLKRVCNFLEKLLPSVNQNMKILIT